MLTTSQSQGAVQMTLSDWRRVEREVKERLQNKSATHALAFE
jgi:hypothetical protein